MRILWCDSTHAFDSLAADRFAQALTVKSNAVVALPTGQTPLGLYAILRLKASSGEMKLSAARFFNLDEYVGLDAAHPLSYARYLQMYFLEPAGVPAEHARLLRGDASDLVQECRDYDEAIARVGGLDLAILGLGTNGHIAFNEPGSAWHTTTHVIELSSETRAVHSQQQLGQHIIPTKGLTIGVATIVQAREVLLLVVGAAKRRALDALRQGVPDPRWPVTSLIDHPRLTVLADAQLQ